MKFKLVPEEPTEEMKEAGCDVLILVDGIYAVFAKDVANVYQAMLAAAPSPPAKDGMSERCTWKLDEDTSAWETTCGHAFILNDGTPQENDMHYCPYCGKSLAAYEGNEEGK